MKQHVNIVVHGHVQGVLFRFSARVIAETIGVFGYVENRSDGSVYIEVEGEKEKLKKFIAWCHKGPQDAKVEKVEATFSNDLKNFKTFESVHSKK